MARGLTKEDKSAFAILMLAEANIGKLDVFNDSDLKKYYETNNLAAQGISERQYQLLSKEVRKQSKFGLDPEQLLATTVIRNIAVLDKVEEDLGLVAKHVKLCEQEIVDIHTTHVNLQDQISKEKAPSSEEEFAQRKRDYETLSRLFDQKQKTRNALASFIKMKSALYKNVNEISKNQTELNYKMAMARENKRKNDILMEQLRQKNPDSAAIDAEFDYSDSDVEELEEAIKIQVSDKKHLLEGLMHGD